MSLLRLIRRHRGRIRRGPRKERTPYYFTGLTPQLTTYILECHREFLTTFGRDYEDEDPQFWIPDAKGLRPTPVEMSVADAWFGALSAAMRASNHHPAHIHAMNRTRKIIFGCGTPACFDLDDCPNCNFRSVPEGWTKAWEAATREYERWGPDIVTPTEADMALVKGSRL